MPRDSKAGVYTVHEIVVEVIQRIQKMQYGSIGNEGVTA